MSFETYRVTMIVGSRGTGKTGTLIRRIIPKYIATRFKAFGRIKIAVLDLEKNYNYEKFDALSDPHYPEARKQVLRRFIRNPVPVITRDQLPSLKSGVVRILPGVENAGEFTAQAFQQIVYDKRVAGCMIVIEDTARFMPDNNGLDSTLRDMIINSKQRSMDLVLMFHFWTDVPPKLLKWIDEVYLHKCDESALVRSKSIAEVKLRRILEAEQRVLQAADKFACEYVTLN